MMRCFAACAAVALTGSLGVGAALAVRAHARLHTLQPFLQCLHKHRPALGATHGIEQQLGVLRATARQNLQREFNHFGVDHG